MLVLTWNIQRRVKNIGDIIARVASIAPDIVTLQEVSEGALATLVRGLEGAGLVYCLPSLARRKGNLILSRWPIRAHALGSAGMAPQLPFPELLSGVTAMTEAHGDLEIITTHMPNGARNGEKKIAHFRRLSQYLRTRPTAPCVLTGDFNSPRFESANEVLCFGGTYKRRGQAWEEAEQAIMTGMPTFGMRDVFRAKHGYDGPIGSTAYSHEYSSSGQRVRLDHIFASAVLKVTEVAYETSWLEQSDHAGLWARFVA